MWPGSGIERQPRRQRMAAHYYSYDFLLSSLLMWSSRGKQPIQSSLETEIKNFKFISSDCQGAPNVNVRMAIISIYNVSLPIGWYHSKSFVHTSHTHTHSRMHSSRGTCPRPNRQAARNTNCYTHFWGNLRSIFVSTRTEKTETGVRSKCLLLISFSGAAGARLPPRKIPRHINNNNNTILQHYCRPSESALMH